MPAYRHFCGQLLHGRTVCELRHVDAYRPLADLLDQYGVTTPEYRKALQAAINLIDADPHQSLKALLYKRLSDHLKKNMTRRKVSVAKVPQIRGSTDRQCANRFGFTVAQFIVHVESRFASGMNWDRVVAGDVQIDHEVPPRCFDLSLQTGVMAAYSLSNTKPMWRGDNARKGRTTDLNWINLFGDGCFRE